jgi:hypothetical protein
MRRLVLGGLIVGAAILGLVGPAAAHEEINPSTFPTAKPVFFTLDVANETRADLVKVTLNAPSGVGFGATTKDPSGWTVNRTDQVITWSGGSVKPDRFEQWGFEIEGADQPGTLTYKATLGYADGKTGDVSIDVNAVASVGSGSAGAGAGSNSRANAALGAGIVALVLALAGLAMGARRGRPQPATPGTDAAKAADW